MSKMLQDKVVLITGAAGGIGSATALAFARHGARLVVADLNGEGVEETAQHVREIGREAIAIRTDITDEAQVADMIALTIKRYGRLDGAFNNAGNGDERWSVEDLPLDIWNRNLALCLTGTFLCAKHELKAMLATGGGAIVNNASNSGIHAAPMMASYGAGKAGVINLTKTIAIEYAAKGIRANALCPGLIATPPIRAAMERGIDYRSMVRLPMERLGEPLEIAEMAAWLLSPLASFVNGQAISVDGGQSVAT